MGGGFVGVCALPSLVVVSLSVCHESGSGGGGGGGGDWRPAACKVKRGGGVEDMHVLGLRVGMGRGNRERETESVYMGLCLMLHAASGWDGMGQMELKGWGPRW